MDISFSVNFWISLVFLLGYLGIIFESYIRVNKTATALLMATACWALFFLFAEEDLGVSTKELGKHIGNVSQIIFFLLGAMTLVELIDSHKGFKIITDVINMRAKRKMLWLIGLITFFLSALLDNLTTTIVMVSLLRKLIPQAKERKYLAASIVIAANAGGAWTPIGDVTTTMLWINGQVTTLPIMQALFFPSLISLVVTLCLLGLRLKGHYDLFTHKKSVESEPGARLIFFTGISSLIAVPFFKGTIGLPPFMGILIGLGVLWLITDLLHAKHEARTHLRVPHVLTKIDTSGVLFFLGILLTIDALESIGILRSIALFLQDTVPSLPIVAILIGLLSAIVDNVPLVAGTMGMYPLSVYPVDDGLWQMIAYCAGTGGSILIIGSAAGVALMGMEKMDFLWYTKRISLSALLGYLSGIGFYLLFS